jgi:hypothetical protein
MAATDALGLAIPSVLPASADERIEQEVPRYPLL